MSGKNIIFNDKEIKKSTFSKNQKIYSTDDINVNNISVLKKNHMVIKTHLNTLLDTMIVILLDQYV